MSSQGAKDDSEELRRTNPGLCTDAGSARCQEYDGKRDDAESAAAVSYVGYIAGGALLASAVVTYLLWPKSSERAAGWKPQPVVGVGVVGAGFEGRF